MNKKKERMKDENKNKEEERLNNRKIKSNEIYKKKRKERINWEEEKSDEGGDIGANVLDCEIIVSEFKLQSDYCIHFRTHTLGKISHGYWSNSITTVFLSK